MRFAQDTATSSMARSAKKRLKLPHVRKDAINSVNRAVVETFLPRKAYRAALAPSMLYKRKQECRTGMVEYRERPNSITPKARVFK